MNSLCFAVLLAGTWLSVSAAPQCSDGYSSGHTLCLKNKGTILSMPWSEKQAVVNKHNFYRNKERASDMFKLRWNNDLATVAAKWAAQCSTDPPHDTSANRKLIQGMLAGERVGQNAARGYSSFTAAVEGWWSEISDFTYGSTPPTDKATGHYTQVVWAETVLIGCGKANCGSYTNYVCNYATAGNFNFEKRGWKPYSKSSGVTGDCSGQADSTYPNLCNCAYKTCQNGGVFRATDDCNCDCSGTNYVGARCENLRPCGSGDTDDSTCQLYKDAHGLTKACSYSNVKADCPRMCQQCQP